MPVKGFAGAAVPTATKSQITKDDMTFEVKSTEGWDFGGKPFVLTLSKGKPHEEKVLCSDVDGDGVVAVLERAYDGTQLAEHGPGASVVHSIDAQTVAEVNAHANDDTSPEAHAQYATHAEVAAVAVAGGSTYTHNQVTPAASWLIVHNLNRHPSVTIVDSAGGTVESDIVYIDSNTVRVDHISPFGGVAYLN